MNTNLITVTAQIGKCIYHIEMEVKGQELELQEKRMILEAIQGGVDSMLKFG